MRYGLSLYNGGTFNQQVFTVSGVIEVNAVISQTLRLRNVVGTGAVVCVATVGVQVDCYAAASGNVVAVAQAAVQRVRIIKLVGAVDVTGLAVSTALCLVAAQATVSVVGQARPVALWCGRAGALVVVGATAVSQATCFVEFTASVSVTGTASRTRVRYASFGQAVVIRAANNEGLRIPSASVLYSQRGSLEFVVQPFAVTAPAARYLFDGGGAANKNLVVLLTTDGRVQVSYGTGASTVTVVSASPVPPDGGVWVGVGWNADGVELYLDGQLVASSTQAPNIESGANFYVGCSAAQADSLDGLLDEFRVSSRKRTAAEFQAAREAGVLGLPLEWDVDTTYLLHFNGDFSLPENRQAVWVSPAINAAAATDYSSLVVLWAADTPANAAIACQVRTSPDGQNWSMWYDQVNNEFTVAPPNPYAQVRFIFQVLENASTPTLHDVMVIYEGAPTADVLKAGLSYSTTYSFAQLVDKMVICNGVDLPLKYDGITVTSITSAPVGKAACAYRERLFIAKGSTLYYSDPTNVDSWPATNFIDVNPDDGDEIVALVPLATTLLIVKRYNLYFLSGYGPQSFKVEPAGKGGTIAPRGVVDTPYGVFEVDREGVWVTDFRTQEQVTLPIRELWLTLNQRALEKVAMFYQRDKLLVAVPGSGANYNSMLLVYDLVHKAWAVWDDIYASCFTVFHERGKWVYLFGDSRTGNVWEFSDSGEPFTAVVETKHYTPVSGDMENRFLWLDLVFAGGGVDTLVRASVVIDGQSGGWKEFTVPAKAEKAVYRLYPAAVGSSMGVKLEMPGLTSEGPVLLEMTAAYYSRTIRPVRVVQAWPR